MKKTNPTGGAEALPLAKKALSCAELVDLSNRLVEVKNMGVCLKAHKLATELAEHFPAIVQELIERRSPEAKKILTSNPRRPGIKTAHDFILSLEDENLMAAFEKSLAARVGVSHWYFVKHRMGVGYDSQKFMGIDVQGEWETFRKLYPSAWDYESAKVE